MIAAHVRRRINQRWSELDRLWQLEDQKAQVAERWQALLDGCPEESDPERARELRRQRSECRRQAEEVQRRQAMILRRMDDLLAEMSLLTGKRPGRRPAPARFAPAA